LQENPLTIARDQIKNIEVLMTIANGKIVYQKEKTNSA
jgi:predicted amidohydrolase YtcJ